MYGFDIFRMSHLSHLRESFVTSRESTIIFSQFSTLLLLLCVLYGKRLSQLLHSSNLSRMVESSVAFRWVNYRMVVNFATAFRMTIWCAADDRCVGYRRSWGWTYVELRRPSLPRGQRRITYNQDDWSLNARTTLNPPHARWWRNRPKTSTCVVDGGVHAVSQRLVRTPTRLGVIGNGGAKSRRHLAPRAWIHSMFHTRSHLNLRIIHPHS